MSMDRSRGMAATLALLSLCIPLAAGQGAEPAERPSPWRVNLLGSALNYEGDEAVRDTFLAELQVEYALSEVWSLAGVFAVAPDLKENFRFDIPTGRSVSRLQEKAGVKDTSAAGFGLDALYRPLPDARIQPYLALGAGFLRYSDDFDGQTDALLRLGGGVLIPINESWAFQLDARVLVADDDTEFNSIYGAGLSWRPAARREVFIPPALEPAPAPVPPPAAPEPAAAPDADGDGLSDADELSRGTDPKRVDTDWDGLSDFDEIRLHLTDPLKRDTDGGGVADGHEVIEDRTNPLVKTDDLEFFELHLDFDPGRAVIKAEYFAELDAIGRAAARKTGARVRVEGHLDPVDAAADAAKKLSQERAAAVMKYLQDVWKVPANRIEAVGYGALRPKGPSAPPAGNLDNRRIEIYIRAP